MDLKYPQSVTDVTLNAESGEQCVQINHVELAGESPVSERPSHRVAERQLGNEPGENLELKPADKVFRKEGEQICSPQHQAKSAASTGFPLARVGQEGAEPGVRRSPC